MKIIILTHQGLVTNEDTDFIQVVSEDANFGILENHIPLVTVINEGYLKYNFDKNEKFVSLCGAIFEFSNNKANVLAQEAQVGADLEDAKTKMIEFRNRRIEINRKESVDFSKKEKELRDHIKNAGAGNL